jgi:hypothetical protein
MIKRVLKKEFFLSICWKQNRWHRHGVFLHTLKVVYFLIKDHQYKMIPAGFLHDIGKPFVVYQDKEDKITGEYSFTNHEEISYQLIKDYNFISNYTKYLVRYHYLIRGMGNSKKRGEISKYKRLKRIYDKLDVDIKKDINIFVRSDDKGK